MTGKGWNGAGTKGKMDDEVDSVIARMRKRNLLFSDRSLHVQQGEDSYF